LKIEAKQTCLKSEKQTFPKIEKNPRNFKMQQVKIKILWKHFLKTRNFFSKKVEFSVNLARKTIH